MIENIVRPIAEWMDDLIHYPTHRRNRKYREILNELAEKYSLNFANGINLNINGNTIMFLDAGKGTLEYISRFRIANREEFFNDRYVIYYPRLTILCDYDKIKSTNKNKIEAILVDVLKKFKDIKQELKIRELNEDFE
jgi:hypothetical protein